jgi:uncharacterized protein
MKLTIAQLRQKGLILLEAISGSNAYGLNLPTSDTDIRGVFILPEDELLGLHYIDQVADDTNDVIFYELGRYVDLLIKNNPNILELLAVPDDCLIYKHPILNLLKPEEILSKICRDSFAGYAKAQIIKARGLNKKVVNPMDEKRKGILDFCHVVEGQGSVPVLDWLARHGWDQADCGLVNVPHMREIFALFYGGPNAATTIGFKGIMHKDNSNGVSLSSIPKGMEPVGVMAFNKDGYSVYCKDYKEYWDWVAKRNEVRYEGTISHGKNYDAKNMMHTFRLLDMAAEIAEGKLLVRRPNREFLLGIRRGEHDYDTLLAEAEARLPQIDAKFAASTLPDKPDADHLNRLLIQMRKAIYAELRSTAQATH